MVFTAVLTILVQALSALSTVASLAKATIARAFALSFAGLVSVFSLLLLPLSLMPKRKNTKERYKINAMLYDREYAFQLSENEYLDKYHNKGITLKDAKELHRQEFISTYHPSDYDTSRYNQ